MRRAASFPGKTMESLLPMREGGEGGGGVVIKILQSLKEVLSENSCDMTKTPPIPPPPAGDK